MTPSAPDEDGALRPALNALEDAIAALTEPRQATINGERVIGASPYMQLWDAVSGESSNGGGSGGGSKSRPPMWLDAFDELCEIDQAVECWQPAFTGVPPTVGRLRCILARSWRPQDVRAIEQISTTVKEWVVEIDELMNPAPHWSLPHPCPACNTAVVYRPDSGGELIRKPALQIGPEGCTCQKCRYTWSPDYFTHLAAVLGCPLPPGVLE